jgi:hypothetical protein
MRSKRAWVACIAAAMGLSATGCQTYFGGMTLPSPRYLEHQPQYFPADPTFPLPRELATQTDPAGAAGGLIGPAGAALVPPPGPVPVPEPGAPALQIPK